MPIGLPVQRVINVSISLTPPAAAFENFDTLLVMGDSNVIDTYERFRSYSGITGVANDFGTTAPEYLAALLYFSQIPEPTQLYIGRWARLPTHGRLVCGTLSSFQQAMANWVSIAIGSFSITIDGAQHDITGLNFGAATNLNGVASIIQTALNSAVAGTTCVWDGIYHRFIITSPSTGFISTVSFLSAAASGANISGNLKGTSTTAMYAVGGIPAESAVASVVVMDNLPVQWYGLMFATGNNNANITDSDHLAIAAYVEASGAASGNPHIYGLSTSESSATLINDSTDIGSEIMAAGYERTFYTYETTSPYEAASMYGRLFTVDFNAQNSTITLMWKRLPGVVAETLLVNQADALDAKRYNYYVRFNNNSSILVNGMMGGPAFIDEIFNMDAFGNRIQTDIYNLMVTTPTKIPQTDAGLHRIGTVIESSCEAFVNNAFLAPGTWQSDGFGILKYNDFLPRGYYVYIPPVALQAPADRALRKTPTIQVACKEAGAIHDVVVNVLVNR